MTDQLPYLLQEENKLGSYSLQPRNESIMLKGCNTGSKACHTLA